MRPPPYRARHLLVPLVAALVAGSACTGELWTESGDPPVLMSDAARGDGGGTGAPDAGHADPDAAEAERPDATVPPPPDAWVAPPPGCDDPIEQEVIRLANEARAEAGLGPLTCDPMMVAVARAHSSDMCTRDYFDHTGLDGRSPFDRLRDGGVRFGAAGENIAWGQRDAREVHTSWMNSPGHRRNILGSSYGRIGVGLDRCGGSMYWTQVFAD